MSFSVFTPPTLSPSMSTSVVEGANVPLSCSSTQSDLTVTWTRGSTQLASASSTSSLTHTINNIMRNESGNYTCTLLKEIGGVTVTRIGTVAINVQCHCSKYTYHHNNTCSMYFICTSVACRNQCCTYSYFS